MTDAERFALLSRGWAPVLAWYRTADVRCPCKSLVAPLVADWEAFADAPDMTGGAQQAANLRAAIATIQKYAASRSDDDPAWAPLFEGIARMREDPVAMGEACEVGDPRCAPMGIGPTGPPGMIPMTMLDGSLSYVPAAEALRLGAVRDAGGGWSYRDVRENIRALAASPFKAGDRVEWNLSTLNTKTTGPSGDVHCIAAPCTVGPGVVLAAHRETPGASSKSGAFVVGPSGIVVTVDYADGFPPLNWPAEALRQSVADPPLGAAPAAGTGAPADAGGLAAILGGLLGPAGEVARQAAGEAGGGAGRAAGQAAADQVTAAVPALAAAVKRELPGVVQAAAAAGAPAVRPLAAEAGAAAGDAAGKAAVASAKRTADEQGVGTGARVAIGLGVLAAVGGIVYLAAQKQKKGKKP